MSTNLLILLYIIGVVLAYLIIAFNNDISHDDYKLGWVYIIFSWVTIIWIPTIFIILWITDHIPKHPTLKRKTK